MTINKKPNTLIGRVISDKMSKTVTVLVERKIKHPLYGKTITQSKKIHAHDENNQFGFGDIVVIEEGRPISKTKSWRAIKLLDGDQEKNS